MTTSTIAKTTMAKAVKELNAGLAEADTMATGAALGKVGAFCKVAVHFKWTGDKAKCEEFVSGWDSTLATSRKAEWVRAMEFGNHLDQVTELAQYHAAKLRAIDGKANVINSANKVFGLLRKHDGVITKATIDATLKERVASKAVADVKAAEKEAKKKALSLAGQAAFNVAEKDTLLVAVGCIERLAAANWVGAAAALIAVNAILEPKPVVAEPEVPEVAGTATLVETLMASMAMDEDAAVQLVAALQANKK